MVALFGEMAHVLVLETEHLLQRVVNECCTSAGKVHRFTQMHQGLQELGTKVASGLLMAVVAVQFFFRTSHFGGMTLPKFEDLDGIMRAWG